MSTISENLPHQKHKESIIEKEHREISEIMSRILNVPEKEILRSIDLFSHINPDMKTCLDKLHVIEEKDYINTFMIIEFFIKSDLNLIEKLDLEKILLNLKSK